MNRGRWLAGIVLVVGLCMGAHAVADDRDTCAGASGEIAIDACTRAIDSGASSGTDLSWRFHNRGRAYEAKGDHARAIADFSEAIRLAPKLAFAFNARGSAYEATGDHDRAIADFNEAISLDPTLAYAFNGRGFAYKAKGDQDRAIADFNAAISLDPKLASAFNGRGFVYKAKGDQDRAIADFNAAISLDPKLASAFNGRGFAYSAKGDHDRAIADFNAAIRLDPNYAHAFNNRGLAYDAKGDHDRAIADFNKAISLDPKLAFVFNARGVAYNAKGDHDRAIADFNAAISLDPKLAFAFIGRGFAYRAKGDHDRAIADFNAAISLDPKLAFAFYGRGLAYEAKGDHDRAVADHSEAIGLDPGYSAAFTNRGLAYEARGDRERARADFAVAVAIPPKYDDGRWAQATARDRLGALAAATVGAPVPASVQVGSAPTPRPTIAERRVALVIGNAAYPGAGLANPLNDADDVTAALRRVGFDVVEGKDLALDGFSQIVESFRSKAEGADVALLYYAGHGMQFEDQNWLMPVDTRAGSAFDVRHYNVALQDLISDIETHARTTLVFVDACRKNPLDEALKARLRLQGRAYGEARGLARVEIKSPETLVVFATRPNMTAADGDHRNSPFTEAFLKHLPTPGVEVEVLMKRVTRSVEEMTNHKQQPERLSRLEQEFYFVPAK